MRSDTESAWRSKGGFSVKTRCGCLLISFLSDKI